MEKNRLTLPIKRKMAHEITEDFEVNDTIKKNKGNGVKSVKFSLSEVKGDLFSCPGTASLAHCVSQDLRMGRGIALVFKSKFGGPEEVTDQISRIGNIIVLKCDDRFIYHLVTKERHFQKPTYINIRSSLSALKIHAIQNNVTNLAMPKIGCGLDGLVWDKVKEIITDVFKDTDIRITVYYM